MSGRQRNRREAADGKPSAKAALVKRFKAAERQAEDTLTRWIGHPALQPVVERRRLGAEAVVLPISSLLTDQGEVVRFCWHVYGMAGIDPDWNLRRGEPWMLTIAEMHAIERVKADFRVVVQLAVNELAGAGVGLMPSWDPDHAVIGELLLLPGFPWELPARQRAQYLNPPPVAAIDIDASGTSVRRGTGERPESNITSIRRTGSCGDSGELGRQQNVVLASWVVHDPVLVKYSWEVRAVRPAGQDELSAAGSTSVEE